MLSDKVVTNQSPAVQATGHGIAVPADGGMLIDTRRMNAVRVDPTARVARVQVGARWQQVIDAAAPYGLAPRDGSSPLVGVVGYTPGGGIGDVLGRAPVVPSAVGHRYAAFNLSTLDPTRRRMARWSTGLRSLNFLGGPSTASQARDAFGAMTYRRLTLVKAAYDP